MIQDNTTLKSGRKVPLDASATCDSNIGFNDEEEDVMSLRQVAYNL